MILRELELKDEAAFYKMLDGWDDSPGFSMTFGLVEGLKFTSYLQILEEMKHEETVPFKLVPMTGLFAFEGDVIVGKVNFRHRLNDFLFNVGGHIGYGVLTEFRGQGYATRMLKETLIYARNFGLDRVLVTCDENNIASEKVILNNGGILENLYDPKDGGAKKKRFWIDLAK